MLGLGAPLTEHVPQRVGIPGIPSGRRYVAAEGEGEAQRYFTLYDLDGPEVLDSPKYRAVVQEPTPWSAAMRPSLQRFLRLPCRRVLSLGGGIGGGIATLRLPSGTAPWADMLKPCLMRLLGAGGITAAHLGEPFQSGQPFPLGDPGADGGGGGVVLLEGTSAASLRAVLPQLGAPLHCSQPALYTLAFLAAQPPLHDGQA